MGPGVRYHVVTISAIFLALTIGLVVGSLFASPQFVSQQKHAIRQMQLTLGRLDTEKAAELRTYQEFTASALPRLVRGKLTGVRVAIVQTGDYPDAAARAREALALAGATVTSSTTFGPAMLKALDDQTDDISALHVEDARIPGTPAGLVAAAAAAFAKGGDQGASLFEALDKAHLIDEEDGSTYSEPDTAVVVVSGSRSPDAPRVLHVDLPFMNQLAHLRVRVVTCEPEGITVPDNPQYREARLNAASVDNVNTDIGRCALVYALRGEFGFFGVTAPVTDGTLQP